MDYLPIFLDVRNQLALVVGGGSVAARKIDWLLKAGSRVVVVSPKINQHITTWHQEKRIIWHQREFDDSDAKGYCLVIAATNHEPVNERISRAAKALSIPVNVVDNPALSSFIVPAIVDRDPVIVAISSAGRSPVLARSIRNRLESELPDALGTLAEFIGQQRNAIKQALAGKSVRRVWERFVDGAGAEAAMLGNHAQASALLENLVNDEHERGHLGEVYLIGAGPGDPDLLTFKALRLLQRADAVLYDRLVSPGVLAKIRKDAELIYVGKARAEHSMRQKDINALMIELASQGKTVARLKGGDPFIFGRGGEEIEDLAEAGIPFQVVPGITAASGCASYAGIPLTHREHASSVRFVAGNLHNEQYKLNWPELNTPGETLVFYMSLAKLDDITSQLMQHGKPANTAVAIIEEGTQASQRVIITDLENTTAAIAHCAVHAPALVIMGSVVTLYSKLAWFRTGSYQVYP
ncbi:MAG TPA: siroheme synthase CysG [Pseudomonadales bacterium]